MKELCVKIKNRNIPYIVRSYKSSRSIKAYYKGNLLCISKPTYVSSREVESFIKKYEDYLYKEYIQIKSNEELGIKNWVSGEKILYMGKNYNIVSEKNDDGIISIKINNNKKIFEISAPRNMEKDARRDAILKEVKKLFKANTEVIIEDRLSYWTNITGIDYNTCRVHDATTRYGSCVKSKKALNFSSRLIMLPMDKIDAIVVHELCHIEQANHSQKFYDLVESFIPDYKERDVWLKKNGNILNIG